MMAHYPALGPAWDGCIGADGAARVCRSIPDPSVPGVPRVLDGGVRLYELANRPVTPCCCAIGAFDGVHAGHRALIAAASSDARARGVACAVVTFDPDPARVLAPGRTGVELLSIPDRLAMLASTGVDALVVIPFTPELAALDYRAFLDDVLIRRLGVVAAHVGTNFRMGRDGAGDVAALADHGRAGGVDVVAHDLALASGEPVSATRVRGLLAAGDVIRAADLLGRDHFVRGSVVHGRGEGTGFGFPTANVVFDDVTCLPAEGVYAGYVAHDAQAWPAAINVGTPRSFAGTTGAPMLEANLLGFSGSLYDERVAVSFVTRLRGQQRFNSFDELERTVLGNVQWVREHVGERAVPLDGRRA